MPRTLPKKQQSVLENSILPENPLYSIIEFIVIPPMSILVKSAYCCTEASSSVGRIMISSFRFRKASGSAMMDIRLLASINLQITSMSATSLFLRVFSIILNFLEGYKTFANTHSLRLVAFSVFRGRNTALSLHTNQQSASYLWEVL